MNMGFDGDAEVDGTMMQFVVEMKVSRKTFSMAELNNYKIFVLLDNSDHKF